MTPRMPLWAALAVAAGAGVLLDGAFPDRGWWPLAFPAVALALWAQQGRRLGGGILVGAVFGAAFFYPHVEWATTFLGPIPWSALAGVMALWCCVSAALITLAYRWVPRVWSGPTARLLLLPAVVAGIWTAREAIASVWPYGGFSWGRLGFSQSDSPFSPLFAWVGVSGVTFLMVFVSALGVAVVQEGLRSWRERSPARSAGHDIPALALAVVLPVLVLVTVPPWTSLPGTAEARAVPSTIRIGAVQGDTKAGYFDPPDRAGDNLLGQAEATEPVYGEDVDIVVWPEGGSDLDPLRDPGAAAIWDSVSERAGAPLLAGTITARPTAASTGDQVMQYFNTAILWSAGEGQHDFYDKKHPVPFGEYVPDRAFWRQFAPDLIDLIQREYTPGTTDAVVDLGAGDPGSPLAGVLAGVSICFDIVDDQLLTEIVEQGGHIVFAVTNNADFGATDESVQQLAIARIRAIETARTVVNISTVGTSAIILPDGTITQQLPTYEPGVLIGDVPLGTTMTPAVLVGRQLEWLVSFVGLGGLALGFAGTRRRS